MTLLAQHGFMMARRSSDLADLIASLDPVTWLRLNDNAASSVVTDSSAAPAAGTLYNLVNNALPISKNTEMVSAPGLVTGSGDKAFDFGGNSMVESPRRQLSESVGWAVFCVVRPDVPPPSVASGVGAIWQLTGSGQSVPEMGIVDMPGGAFRFRLMLSGTSEIDLGDLPTWPYGTRLAVVVKREPHGQGGVKMFVSGSKIGESDSFGLFTIRGESFRWGAARFGSGVLSTYYQFPGVMDELTVFNYPLSDAICEQLTAAL